MNDCLQTATRREALRRIPDYVKYIQNLVSTGYFRGEIEGSHLWNELEYKAVDAFIEARREEYVAAQGVAVC